MSSTLYGDRRTVIDSRIRGTGVLVANLAAATAVSATTAANASALETFASSAFAKWTKYTVGHAAFQTAGFTNNIELFSLPAKGAIHAVFINPTVAFSGGLIASYTLSVGIAGNLIKYCPAESVFVAVPQTPQATLGIESVSGATSIRIAATSTVGTLDASTQGSADVYVLRSLLP